MILGSGQFTVYTGVNGPSASGDGGPIERPTSSTGGEVGFDTLLNDFIVPFGYVAGTALTSTSTWNDATLQDLGLMVGSYSYTLGSGDTFVVNIESPVSISPEPSTFALLGTGLLGAIGVVRRRSA